MKVLVLVHTWNDATAIGSALDSIQQQTFPLREILIVDNASTDGTADLGFPANVTVLRQSLNLGTSGSVKAALEYARAQGYQWLWILDCDSRPAPDALELLVDLIDDLAPNERRELGVVCTSHALLKLGQTLRGRMMTPGGPRPPKSQPRRNYIACDSVIWSGSLINVAVVDRVGWPRTGVHGCWEDFSLDYGDTEYTNRIHRAGYRVLVHWESIVDQPVGTGLRGRLLGWTFYSTNHSAFRRYLYFRNLVFFWTRLYPRRNWPMLLVWFGYRLSMILTGILFLEHNRGSKLKACAAGIWDGLHGRLDGNFQVAADDAESRARRLARRATASNSPD